MGRWRVGIKRERLRGRWGIDGNFAGMMHGKEEGKSRRNKGKGTGGERGGGAAKGMFVKKVEEVTTEGGKARKAGRN